jgi:hypothetical protein
MKLTRLRNYSTDTQISHIIYQEQTWPGNPRFRRIILRVTNPKGKTTELSILCSKLAILAEKVIELMLSRWLQENDFCYLRKHFGIDQIDCYTTINYTEIEKTLTDRMCESREFYALKKKRREQKSLEEKLIVKKHKTLQTQKKKQQETRGVKLDQALEKLQEINLNEGESPNKETCKQVKKLKNQVKTLERKDHDYAKKYAEKTKEFDESIAACVARWQAIDDEIAQGNKEESRVQALMEQGYCVLDTRRKAVFDMLRIISRSAFYEQIRDFQKFYDNRRDDHVILRTLTESSGNIYCEGANIIIELWVKPDYGKRDTQRIEAFLRYSESHLQKYFERMGFTPILKLQPTSTVLNTQ